MNKKFSRFLMIIYCLSIIVMLSGATFAYFAIIQVSSLSPHIEAQSATTEWLVFNAGDAISIFATEDNFGENMGNLTDNTSSNILLRTNITDRLVQHEYDMFLDINENGFEYTTDEMTPELLLVVEDPDGNPLTEIPGLNYVDVTSGDGTTISGFDITTASGRYYIADDYEISTNSEAEDTWNVSVVFVNLNTDQQGNTDKVFSGILQIEKSDPEA